MISFFLSIWSPLNPWGVCFFFFLEESASLELDSTSRINSEESDSPSVGVVTATPDFSTEYKTRKGFTKKRMDRDII